MFKNLLVASMLALSSCAFYTNVCDCEDVVEEKQEILNSLLENAIEKIDSTSSAFETVEFLVSKGADIKSIATKNLGTDEKPTYPLYYAVTRGNLKLAELLIKNGADVNKCDNLPCIKQMAIFPDKKSIKFLIDNGADVNYIDKYGESILDIFAIFNMPRKSLPDREEVAQMLINAGAKLNKYKDDAEVKAFLGIE